MGDTIDDINAQAIEKLRSRVPTWLEFVTDLQNLQWQAQKLGLWATSHAINDAVKKAGWEMAEQQKKRSAKPPTQEPTP